MQGSSTSGMLASITPASVIIPAFNDQAGIETCLTALAKQTYPLDAIEVIVVDNCSTPPLQIDGNYPFATRLLHCTKPGSYAARNAGAKAATGQIFAFIDADCWPDEEWLARGAAALMDGNGKTIVGGEVKLICPDHASATALYQCITGFGQEVNARDKGFFATANLLCTRTQFAEVGPFNETLLSGGDREWCWRAATHGFQPEYTHSASVSTHPRTTLRSAIRQARRVVAGRKMLRSNGLTHIGAFAVDKQRTALQSARWILSNRQLRTWDRLRVLTVATVIRGAAALENARLMLGGRAERR